MLHALNRLCGLRWTRPSCCGRHGALNVRRFFQRRLLLSAAALSAPGAAAAPCRGPGAAAGGARAGSELRRTGNPARSAALCLRCGQRKERSACSGPAEPAARHGAEPCLTRYGQLSRPRGDGMAGAAALGAREELPAPPPARILRGRGAAPARGERSRGRPEGAGGNVPLGECVCVCRCRSPTSAKFGPLSPCILICLSPSFGVFREERGRAPGRDTRGPGRRPDGAGSPPGQPQPWKPGSAARGEPCCTTVVSFRFPFPGWVVGCSFSGVGFVRVRLGLPGPLFALGMQKPGFLPLFSQLSVACLY